jgi:hypothetical protein
MKDSIAAIKANLHTVPIVRVSLRTERRNLPNDWNIAVHEPWSYDVRPALKNPKVDLRMLLELLKQQNKRLLRVGAKVKSTTAVDSPFCTVTFTWGSIEAYGTGDVRNHPDAEEVMMRLLSLCYYDLSVYADEQVVGFYGRPV